MCNLFLPPLEAVCRKTLQDVNRDSGAKTRPDKISTCICQPKSTTGGCVVRSIQIARSESEKAEEDRDQATKEQRYTKRNATPRRVFW